MAKQIEINAEISPNLIPMVDIMFLLLLFLMISADMGQRELEDVVLPKAIVVKEDKPELVKDTTGERLTINVYHVTQLGGKTVLSCPVYERHDVCREESHWRIGIKGTDFVDMNLLQARLEKEAAPYRGKDPTNKNISERKVMIRADASAPFGLPQKAMNVCARVGMYKIDVGAALTLGKDDGKKRP
jgi:biopolymer transport protein ExbD